MSEPTNQILSFILDGRSLFGDQKHPLILDGPAFQAVLNENLLPIWDDNFLLLQDNAPPHEAASTMSFLEENGIIVVNDWPPHSPDLSIIENVWKMLGDKRRAKKFTNLNDLRSFSEKEFYSIPESNIQKVFESIPRRIRAVLKHRSFLTQF